MRKVPPSFARQELSCGVRQADWVMQRAAWQLLRAQRQAGAQLLLCLVMAAMQLLTEQTQGEQQLWKQLMQWDGKLPCLVKEDEL